MIILNININSLLSIVYVLVNHLGLEGGICGVGFQDGVKNGLIGLRWQRQVLAYALVLVLGLLLHVLNLVWLLRRYVLTGKDIHQRRPRRLELRICPDLIEVQLLDSIPVGHILTVCLW